jgi:hypothetical protein
MLNEEKIGKIATGPEHPLEIPSDILYRRTFAV